ncbi:solute carrier family 2, facilitated glucose transporter member 8-like [Amblyomma americanum]
MSRSAVPSQQTTTLGGTVGPTSTWAVSAAVTGKPGKHGGQGGGGAMGFTASDITLSRTRVALLSPTEQDELAAPGMHFASMAAPWAGSASVGAAIGYSLPAGQSLMRTRNEDEHFQISDREIFWFDSLLLLGAVFGSMVGCLVTYYIGRRRTLMLACVGLLASWLSIAGAYADSWHLLTARVVGGLCTGMISLAAPAYLAETAGAKERGKMCGAHQTAIAAGVLFIYVLGRYVEWPGLAVFCALPPAVAVLLLSLAVDSPRWLILHDKREEALKTLRILRDTTAQADAEFEASTQSTVTSRKNRHAAVSAWRNTA